MTRREAEHLPAHELTRLADRAARESAERLGLPPVRASMLERWLRVELVLIRARRG